MKVNYAFKHLDSSEALQKYTQSSLDEISQFLLKDGLGQVFYSKFKNEYTIEISINTKEKYFRASGESYDPYQAVDQAVEKLQKQFLKNRKLHKDHKKFDLSKEGQMEHLNERLEYNIRYRKAA